jgi:integrase
MPTRKFSKSWLLSLSDNPPQKLTEYTDTENRYLRARVMKSGVTTLSVRKTPRGGGNAVRRPLGVLVDDNLPTITELRLMASQIAAEIDRHQHIKEEGSDITLEEALSQMLEASNLSANTIMGYERVIKDKHLAKYKDKPLTIWTAKRIVDEARRIGREVGQVAANNDMRSLRRIMNHARALGCDSPAWPTEELNTLKLWAAEKPRERRLEPDEFPVYWAAVKALEPTLWSDMVRMYLLTGMRRRELTNLTTQDLDWRKRSFSFDSKNGRRHTLPMTKTIERILRRRVNEADALGEVELFPVSEPKNAFKHLNNQTGIQLSPHDCRRTFAIIGEVGGVGQYVLKALLNHTPDRNDVTARYVGRIELPDMRDALEKIEKQMKRLAKPKKKSKAAA